MFVGVEDQKKKKKDTCADPYRSVRISKLEQSEIRMPVSVFVHHSVESKQLMLLFLRPVNQACTKGSQRLNKIKDIKRGNYLVVI